MMLAKINFNFQMRKNKMTSVSSHQLHTITSDNWSETTAKEIASAEGIILSNEHIEVLYALREYYSRHEFPHINMRELHDALDEKFHVKGGMKYLYTLFPGGPVAQGCRFAGLEPPAGAVDKGFGSVV